MYDRKYLMERCLCMMIVYLELWKYIGYIYKKSAITVQSRKRFMNGFLLNPILF